MDYWFIRTDGEHAFGGGMMGRWVPGQQITNYIDVPSVGEHASEVERLGGKVIVPKTAVPGMSYFVVCLDSDGNPFGLWESDEHAR